MNWIRSELKAEAKAALSQGYWKAVLVALILAFVGGGGASVGSSASSSFTGALNTNNGGYESYDDYYEDEFDLDLDVLDDLSPNQVAGVIAMVSGIIVLVLLVSAALNIFLFGPLTVGCVRYSELAIKRPVDLNLGRGFSPNYWNVVKVMFMRGLFCALWALLFSIVYGILLGVCISAAVISDIPGGVVAFLMFIMFAVGCAGLIALILKLYDYLMIPYILASDPDMERHEVFRIAKEMVKGEKINILLFYLSFIGWGLLAILTCGILMIFYVNPYKMLAEAALFHKLSEKVGFRVDMEVPPAASMNGGMMGGYNNGGYNNSGYNNNGYNNGGYNNGGYNNGGYNNGEFNKDGYQNDGGYGKSGYGSDGYEKGGYGSGYGNDPYGKNGYGNNSYGNDAYGKGGYDNYGADGYGGSNYGGYGGSGYENGSAGYGHQGDDYNVSPADSDPKYTGTGSPENNSQSKGSPYEEYDYENGHGHPSSAHGDDPKKDQDFDNIDFT